MHRLHKMNRFLLLLLPLAVLLLSGCVGVKLTPQFSHQGQLLGDNGKPVPDGDYEVEYVLFDSASGGTGVYTETQTIPVENGLFTTSLGLTSVMTPTIFSNPTWLQISIDGETLTPRQPLQGAPYAFSLTSGALVQGAEAADEGQAALIVFNTDSTATGGSGLVALNTAAASGTDRADVSALAASAEGGSIVIGDSASDTGSYGAVVSSNAYRGMLVSGGRASDDSRGYFAAVFDSLSGIQVIGGGTCGGCTLSYAARNVGDSPIRAGDFVAIDGVQMDAEFNIPVMQVHRATGPGEDIIGVATASMVRSPAREIQGVRTGGYDMAGTTAAAGEFVTVAVQGLVQARAAAGVALQPGSAISLATDGVVAASGAGIARAMSNVDAEGMVWVMVGSAANGQ